MSTQSDVVERTTRPQIPPSGGERLRSPAAPDLETFLTRALAEGVFGAAFVSAAVIALLGQSKPTERLGYFLIALVVVPLSLAVATSAARRPDARARGCTNAVIQLGLTVTVICATRLADSTHTSGLLLIGLVAVRLVITVGQLHSQRSGSMRPRRLPAAVVPLLLVVAAVPFVPAATLTWVNLAIALACAAALVPLVTFARGWSRPARRTLDVGTVALCTLLVFYLGRPVRELAVNQNYFLGPTTDVLHGHAMLVGTFSQYGYGMFDALAAFFSAAPLGYGSFTVLLSTLTALLFVVIFVVLRLSTTSQILAIAGLAVAVAANVFGQVDAYTFYPSAGVLRFGLAWLVILLSVAAARSDRRGRLLNGLALLVVGASAAWSGESGVYCLGTACAIACIDAIVLQGEGKVRSRAAIRGVLRCLAASVCGVLVFTALTRVAAGAWPDWGSYFDFVRLYTTGGLGELPIGNWSPGLALGALYALSAVALLGVATLRPALLQARPASFRAIAGLTAMGTLVFTYFLGRAVPNNLFHIAPPGIALLFVWAGVADVTVRNRRTAAIAIGAAIFIGGLVVAGERGKVAEKYPHTALAAVLGTSRSLPDQLQALWHNPVVDRKSPPVVRFISSLRRRAPLIVVLFPSVESETLLRLDRSNAAGTSNPCQESISARGPARAAAGVRALRPGAILVTGSASADGGSLLPIQRYTLALIRSAFTLHRIGADGHGHRAFALAARARGGAPSAQQIAAPAPFIPPTIGCA